MVGTFKIIILAASLEEQTINLFEDNYYDDGSITVESAKNKMLEIWWTWGRNLSSSGPGLVVIMQRLGTDTLCKLFKKANIGP